MTAQITTLDQLKSSRNKFRKERNNLASNILGLVIGDVEKCLIAKKEVDLVRIAKKLIQSNVQTIEAQPDSEGVGDLLYENTILSMLVPKELTEKELRDVIESFRLGSVAHIMAQLKAQYHGQYDGKLASMIAKEYITLAHGV
jgi:uncharacterized protein YqeY